MRGMGFRGNHTALICQEAKMTYITEVIVLEGADSRGDSAFKRGERFFMNRGGERF